MKQDINILIVEDDHFEVESLKEALTVGQIICVKIEQAENSNQALAYLHQEYPYFDVQKPDIIFLSLDLPCVTEQELMDELKREETLANIPLVVLIGSDQDKEAIEAYSFERPCFIFKKPDSCQDWLFLLKCIEDVWQTVVQLPVQFKRCS